MFVVPVKNDKIKTKDSSEVLKVSSYTSLKDEPAVYVKPAGNEPYVYFSDIVEINGVRVEYIPDKKIFDALGPLKRKFNLPQPKDTIKVKLIDVPFKDELESFEVTGLILHSKHYGEERGLIITTKQGKFSLNDVIDLERNGWTEKFDHERFKKMYFDYLPIGIKRRNK